MAQRRILTQFCSLSFAKLRDADVRLIIPLFSSAEGPSNIVPIDDVQARYIGVTGFGAAR
jgi:hypothetical protein